MKVYTFATHFHTHTKKYANKLYGIANTSYAKTVQKIGIVNNALWHVFRQFRTKSNVGIKSDYKLRCYKFMRSNQKVGIASNYSLKKYVLFRNKTSNTGIKNDFKTICVRLFKYPRNEIKISSSYNGKIYKIFKHSLKTGVKQMYTPIMYKIARKSSNIGIKHDYSLKKYMLMRSDINSGISSKANYLSVRFLRNKSSYIGIENKLKTNCFYPIRIKHYEGYKIEDMIGTIKDLTMIDID